MSFLEEMLENPPKEYRSVPFWSWNDTLDQDELKWQIHEMKDKGIGGFFMHARGGLQTEYMSEEWMECIKASAEEAEKLDMEAWLYDEEGWPSGFAGGRVTALGKYYHMRWMEQEKTVYGDIDWSKSILGIYSEKGEYLGKDKKEIQQNLQKEIYIIYENINPYYVDVLNPKVIEKFIEVTHEEYLKRFQDIIGSSIPGFFTDEPQFAKLKIPYSICLPGEFQRENGYPVETCYTALFREVGDYRKYRYDFWKTISRMYTEGFCKTLYTWCKKHNCNLTGHLMREDSVLMQMQATAGVMPSYEYMDMPGMDWLRRRISSPLTPKQVGSVAAQLDKKFVISEMYAMVGWDCSPEELKWIAQWQYVNGVNKMCQHLEAYTIKGIRKRDFPPSLFYQQSWWENYGKFNDYFARLGMILTRGGAGAEVLLLHPMRSGWMLYDGEAEGKIADFGQRFEELSQYLSDIHIEHHYGDEEIIKRHGNVEGNILKIGSCSYKAVIVPEMLTMERSTAKLLFQFHKAGGHIYSIGEFPQYLNGEKDTLILNELKQCTVFLDREHIKEQLVHHLEFPVYITENKTETAGVHYQRRDDQNRQYLYIVNLNQHKKTHSLVRLPGRRHIQYYDPLTNQAAQCQASVCGDCTEVELRLNEMEGAVLVIEEGANKQQMLRETEPPIYITNGGRWDIIESELNSMTLDQCAYRVEYGEWREKTPTIRLMNILLNEKKSVHVSLRFEFYMEVDPLMCSELYLVSEVRERLKAHINGTYVEIEEQGFWKDKSFKKYDIRSWLQKGVNEVILEIDFRQPQKVYDVLFGEDVLETEINKLTYETEIESIYLLGDFGVYNSNGYQYSWRKELVCDDSFVIAKKPDYVYGDDFTSQGFCFFAGTMKLKQKLLLHEYDDSRGVKIESNKGKKYCYRFGRPNAAMAKLYVNGQKVQDVLWQPFECDITKYVHTGENEIVWELYASNRNLLGPHHHQDGELYAVWPADFTDTPHTFKKDKRNVWSDEYHFVKFGLQGGTV